MESFFLAGGSFDEIEIKELLLRRYHTLDFVEEFELLEFIEFINKAREKDLEDKLYMQWCAMLPQMNKYMPFKEFSDIMTGANIDTRPAEVIIKEIEDLHRKEGVTVGIGNI